MWNVPNALHFIYFQFFTTTNREWLCTKSVCVCERVSDYLCGIDFEKWNLLSAQGYLHAYKIDLSKGCNNLKFTLSPPFLWKSLLQNLSVHQGRGRQVM